MFYYYCTLSNKKYSQSITIKNTIFVILIIFFLRNRWFNFWLLKRSKVYICTENKPLSAFSYNDFISCFVPVNWKLLTLSSYYYNAIRWWSNVDDKVKRKRLLLITTNWNTFCSRHKQLQVFLTRTELRWQENVKREKDNFFKYFFTRSLDISTVLFGVLWRNIKASPLQETFRFEF